MELDVANRSSKLQAVGSCAASTQKSAGALNSSLQGSARTSSRNSTALHCDLHSV